MNKLVPPKYTTPLTKLVRTLEGILVILACIVLIVAAIVNDISPDLAAKLGAGLVGVTTLARTILKTFANVLHDPNNVLPTVTQADTSSESTGESNAVATPEQATQEFMAIAPAEEELPTPLPTVVPPYDYQEDNPMAPLPQGIDTPEARGEDPTL